MPGNIHTILADYLRYLAKWGDAAGLYVPDSTMQKRAQREGLVTITEAEDWRDRRVVLTEKGRQSAEGSGR